MGASIMKFNPYTILLTIGVLMFATVIATQMGPGLALVKAGAASVNRDFSRLASKSGAASEPEERRVKLAALVDDKRATQDRGSRD